MNNKKKQDELSMSDLTKRYEEFAKNKQIKPNAKQAFQSALKKAVKSKPRGSK